MTPEPISAQEIQEKVEEYATFLRTVLRPDYDSLCQALRETKQEIVEYEELRARLDKLQNHGEDASREAVLGDLTQRVDLGHQKVYCGATIDDNAKYVYVHVGMGFHVELSIPEALAYLEKRIMLLASKVLPYREAKIQHVLTHIQSSEMILDQLSNELARMAK